MRRIATSSAICVSRSLIQLFLKLAFADSSLDKRLLRLSLLDKLAIAAFLLVALQPTSKAQGSPADLSITASPAVVQPTNGKLPPALTLAVFANDCEKINADLTQYSLQLTGIGLSLAQPSTGKCTITAKMNIDPNAPTGQYKILLLDKDGKPRGRADFAVMEASAGAIPSGLAPQVDVMWEVLSQSVCNDVFGKRVARNFYCIEIKIGNNTGHPLQLAGVGFSNHIDKLPGNPIIHANTSYASTRAVLLREEVLSPRNLFYHSLQGTGLVMAGFIPFFHAANATAHYATAVSIVTGPLLQAINIAGPDRVVGQLNNLDDESFRDSQIVPNNTQIRTIVFVEKRALTEQLSAISEQVSSMNNSQAASLTQPAMSKLDGTESTATQQQENSSSDKSQATAMSSQGKSAPNFKTALQKQVTSTEKNSQQLDKNPVFRFSTGDFSPLIVKLALGNLVVIGDEIEYLQRVQVQGTPSTAGASSATVTPLQLAFGNQNIGSSSAAQTVTLTNSGSTALSNLAVSLSGTNQNDFSQTNTCGTTAAAGANCTISVTFTPAAQGARGASLVIAYSGISQSVSLSGVGVGSGGGGLVFSPTPIPSFGTEKVGQTTTAKTLTITNSGQAPATGLAISITGQNAIDFSQTSQCSNTLAAGANCTVSMTFKPTATGARVATLIVTYTSGGTQLTPSFSLTGVGQ
jgi:hypothetical protein